MRFPQSGLLVVAFLSACLGSLGALFAECTGTSASCGWDVGGNPSAPTTCCKAFALGYGGCGEGGDKSRTSMEISCGQLGLGNPNDEDDCITVPGNHPCGTAIGQTGCTSVPC